MKIPIVGLVGFAWLSIVSIGQVFGTTISLPGDTGDANMLDAGFFPGGSILQITSSGVVDLTGGNPPEHWYTNPDGSLAAPITYPPDYFYANVGATDYPTTFGGDGINHYVGGGANYDTIAMTFPFAGLESTDTTNPETIRVGAVVGTFVTDPTRQDWFLIGDGATITAPAGDGANLFLAVNDTYSPNNTGSYSVGITVVPEPSTLALLGVGAFGLVSYRLRQRKQRHTSPCL